MMIAGKISVGTSRMGIATPFGYMPVPQGNVKVNDHCGYDGP